MDSVLMGKTLGDSSDFAELITREERALQSLARKFVWTPEDARDLVQSALVEAYEKRAALRSPQAGGAWLRRILVSRALNHLRRQRVWASIKALVGAQGSSPPPDLAVGDKEDLLRVRAAVQRLPARQAMAFILRYLQGMSVDEVADAMEIDKGTARIHIQRALRRLRSWLVEGAP